jgi:uncharacterized membrane protein
MEQFAREVVAVLIPIVDLVGAVVIGAGVLVAFVAYVLSELRLRPQPYEGVRLLLGRFLALGLEFQLAPTSWARPSRPPTTRSASSGPSRPSGRR